MSIGHRDTIAYGRRWDVHVRLRGRTVHLGRFATRQAAERRMEQFWAEERKVPSESKWTVAAREHVSKLRRRKRGELMDELKKATAAMPVQAAAIPPGAIAPQIQARAAHPLDALHQEGARLQAKLHQLALEFNLAQRSASRVIRPDVGYWCGYHGCGGEIMEGVCTVCKRRVGNVLTDVHAKPRLRLPIIEPVPDGVAEVVRLRKAIERCEKEIETWKAARAQAEVTLMEREFGNKPGRPSEYTNRHW